MTIQQIKQRYGIVGNSREINTAVEIAMQVAPTEVSVLVVGENGTGKDVFSRIIHQFSKRKHQPFIAINTGAIPEGTLDSELFGHERGSFTSAYETRKGYFEEVEGGTIFLDEIGEMPLPTQARLLRLLENGEYLRVGSSKVRKADVRVIAATNKNLVEMIRQGRFREDLFFRLNTVTIQAPPLRDRGDDIELLFQYFALEFAEKYHRNPVVLEPEAAELLYQYRWPGNVRELKNMVEKLTVLVKGELISPLVLQKNLMIQETYLPALVRPYGGENREFAELPSQEEHERVLKLIYDLGKEVAELKRMVYLGFQQNREGEPMVRQSFPNGSQVIRDMEIGDNTFISPPPAAPTSLRSHALLEESLSLEKKEKEMILKALSKFDNNRKKAAAELGISERTLYRKIKNFDILI